jgi:hypothetical protein
MDWIVLDRIRIVIDLIGGMLALYAIALLSMDDLFLFLYFWKGGREAAFGIGAVYRSFVDEMMTRAESK